MTRLIRNPIALGFLTILLLILVASTFAIVPETKQAVIVRFGEPQRILNKYRPNEPFGRTGAGLAVRIPFMEQIYWIDKRIQSIEMENQQVLSTDQYRLQVDAFARYRIVDPLRMYISATTEERVTEQLRPILASALRNALDRVARQYGAQIVDVRIKRADLPDGTPLEAAFDRMRTARRQEASSIEAQGLKQAQIIRADADAEAAATYAQAYNQDPVFFDFYRAMQSYERSFIGQPEGANGRGRTSIILSPNNEYLRQFRGNR